MVRGSFYETRMRSFDARGLAFALALFAGTAVLAALGMIERPRSLPTARIAHVSEVPEGRALYFGYPNPEDESVLLHLPGGGFVAYSSRCTHLSCAVYYQPERSRLYCPCHEGVFNPLTGDPVAGPPQRRLEQIALRREGDVLYALGRTP